MLREKDIVWAESRDLYLWKSLLEPLDVAFKIRNLHSLVFSYAVSWFQGKLLSTFGGNGQAPGEFRDIVGIVANPTTIGQEIRVADSSNHRIQIFDSDGKYRGHLSTGQLVRPINIYGGNNGGYYLSIQAIYNQNIQLVWMSEHEKFHSAQINVPIAQLSAIAYDTNYLYITDWSQHVVYVKSLDGAKLVRTIGTNGVASDREGQLQQPFGLCIHDQHYLCVCEYGNSRISVFDCRTSEFIKHIRINKQETPKYCISIGDQLMVNVFATNIILIIEFADGSCRRQFTLPEGQTEYGSSSYVRGITILNHIVFIADTANRIHRFE
jgi:DNA-binding beta-propeller fold protein YncE